MAVDGRDALEHLTTMRYDAVLMDCMLPTMSGFEACRIWRETEASEGRSRLPYHCADGECAGQ